MKNEKWKISFWNIDLWIKKGIFLRKTFTTVEPLMFWQSRDPISTVLCHSIRLKSSNEQGGATVENRVTWLELSHVTVKLWGSTVVLLHLRREMTRWFPADRMDICHSTFTISAYRHSRTSKVSMTSSMVFNCENAPHELCTMVRFGAYCIPIHSYAVHRISWVYAIFYFLMAQIG